MGVKTKIDYCDSTTNPCPTCTGCELHHEDPKENHCYAADMILRYAGLKGWPQKFTEIEYFPERLPKAIGWSDLTGKDRPEKPWLNGKPRVVFVNDMGDGFCSDADPDAWLTPHIDAMAGAPHIWLFLTKWPHFMANYFAKRGNVPENFWLGTTMLRQSDQWRLRWMRHLPECKKWLSLEPLLDWVDIEAFWYEMDLHLVAIGGESGSNARPFPIENAVDLIKQCKRKNIFAFVKQLGTVWARERGMKGKGDDDSYWPGALKVKEFPV